MQKITYTEVNGYKIPNLALPDDGLGEEVHIGVLGQQRREYLKQHKRVLYSQLLVSGKLRAHLHDIDVTAHARRERMVRQMAEVQDVTERLKAENQMLWVGKMNNIRSSVDEIIRNELIYD